ncbi:MAG: transaldolase [Chloroflexota bacterium]
MATNPLKDLTKVGQSIWYDNLNRELVVSGELQRLIDDDGVTGGTSNPSIFEKAVGAGDAYDAHVGELVTQGKQLDQFYDGLTVKDIQLCCDILRPIYDKTKAADGYASLEVSPDIAYDTQASTRDAKRLFAALGKANAMIKIPGTPAGLPAIEECLTEGVNINITLLFGVENYEQVARAYIRALQKRHQAGRPIDRVASVASFFVSRVDTLIDKLLDEKIERARNEDEKAKLEELKGKAGVANAKIAYAKFKEIFSGQIWENLVEAGARVQKPLWASTSTKNPTYRDVIYVEELIGKDTINTMPQNTLEAFRDHGVVKANSIEEDVEGAFADIRRLQDAGIDFSAVTNQLQDDGVKQFSDAFKKANDTVSKKRDKILAEEQAGAGVGAGAGND